MGHIFSTIDSVNLLLKVEKFFPPNSFRTCSTLILFMLAYIEIRFAASSLFLSPLISDGMDAASVLDFLKAY